MYLSRLGSFFGECRRVLPRWTLASMVEDRPDHTSSDTSAVHLLRDLLTAVPESIVHVHMERSPFGQRQCQKMLLCPIRLREPQDHDCQRVTPEDSAGRGIAFSKRLSGHLDLYDVPRFAA
jgi:hypothetical protein